VKDIKKDNIRIQAPDIISDLLIGGSVAVDGACLTVVGKSGGCFAADVMPITFHKTILGKKRKGDYVNLELPMKAGDRFEGHMVSGHVEGTAELKEQKIDGNSYRLVFRLAPALAKYAVPQGSIALNGISLTIADIKNGNLIVSTTPYTWEATNLHDLSIGDKVNIETDLLAKYFLRLQN
jgi:riboflavin synthase